MNKDCEVMEEEVLRRIVAYLTGEISPAEEKVLRAWVSSAVAHKRAMREFLKIWRGVPRRSDQVDREEMVKERERLMGRVRGRGK